MTYKEYEIIVEKLEERLDCGLITESTAEAINSYCYDKYMESYVDEMCDALEDEYDESTALSKHIYNNYEDKLKKLKDEKRKVDAQIRSLEKLHKTAKEGSSSKKSIEERLRGLRDTSERLGGQLDSIELRDRPRTDTKYVGKLGWEDEGTEVKKQIRKKYNTEPVKPREPGLYKKIQDNK